VRASQRARTESAKCFRFLRDRAREMRVCASLAVAAGICAAARPARSETVTLRAAMDTTIYEETPSASNGAGAFLFAGNNADGAARRALIAFDVGSAVPAGSTIQSAQLLLSMSRSRASDNTIEVHRLTAAWGEGTSNASGNEGGGAPAADGDATWSNRRWPDTLWTNPGGDFDASVSASTVVGGPAAYVWSDPLMATDVQKWLDDPSGNFGWILVGTSDSGATAKRFGSRDGSSTGGPELTIVFTPPAKPIGACCESDGTCGIVLDPGQACAGSYQGSGTTCTPNVCPAPVAVCCTLDAKAQCSVTTQAECAANGGGWRDGQRSCAPNPCTAVLTPFVDALPLPAVATPIAQSDTGLQYRLAMVQRQQQLHRDLPPTTVWGFDDGTTGGGTPGPTLETRAGVPIRVTWANDLRDAAGNPRTTHALPVDTCVDGATSDAPRTVTHLHGGHVPAEVDGSPDATLLPGQDVTYDYPNNQGAATLWYHDHAMGITRLNVMMGLAGFYIVRDATEDALGLPSGRYEIPLVLQDRSFHPDGSFSYPEMWMEHFFGDTVMVNGKVWPYLRVDRGLYRFRVLNGSNSRTYTLQLSPFISFVQIGSDGGLLRNGVAKGAVTIAPGERADLIIDFAQVPPGQDVLMVNAAAAPYPNGDDANRVTNVMKFVITNTLGLPSRTFVNLRAIDAIDPATAAQTRDFVLDRADDPCGGALWRINELGYDDITENPRLGTSEIWRFINKSGEAHPMHLHLVQFQVLDRQPFTVNDDDVVLTGAPIPRSDEESGWKDTVLAPPFQVTRIIARFEDYVGRFPYHCHMLEHEDHAMMRQFETLPACGSDGCPGDGTSAPPPGVSDPGGVGCRIGRNGSATPRDRTMALVLSLGMLIWARRRRGARRGFGGATITVVGVLVGLLFVGTGPGCSSTDNNATAADAGTVADARPTADAGTVADARPTADAGTVADARPTADAGTVADAGSTTEAGTTADAGSVADSGSVSDAGSAADGGSTVLPFGAACTDDAGCASGWCALFGNGSMHCTVGCTQSSECPAGTQGQKCNGKGFCAY
jgi:spore coat protein A